jgi:NAD+ synthase
MNMRSRLEKGLVTYWEKLGWEAGAEAEHVMTWVKNYLDENKISIGVVGLSGGLDSSVVAYLCVKALGSERVKGVLLPEIGVTDAEDLADARLIARELGIETTEHDISPLIDVFVSQNPRLTERGVNGGLIYGTQLGNVKARIRMIKLYEAAQMQPVSSCVLGTTDRSEWFMGYFTKYGDGGVDVEPVLNIYKTQMRGLAKHLSVPDAITRKPSSPNLMPSRTAEQELGFSYEELDIMLNILIDRGYLESDLEEGKKLLRGEYGVENKVIESVILKLSNTGHKRMMPPSPPERVHTRK